jgi:hypothetical protein
MPSSLAVASQVPSGTLSAERTGPACTRVCRIAPVALAQILAPAIIADPDEPGAVRCNQTGARSYVMAIDRVSQSSTDAILHGLARNCQQPCVAFRTPAP